MKIKKILLAFVFILTANVGFTQDSVDKWSLEECVNYALENNLTIKNASLEQQINEANLKQSRLSRIPSLNFDLFNSWRWGRSIDPTSNLFTTDRINTNGLSGSSNVVIYNGNRQVNSIRRDELLAQAGVYDTQKAKNDVRLDVVAAYVQIIFNKELLSIAEQQLATTREQIKRTAKMVEVGSLPRVNLLDLQSQEATNEVDVVNAENNVNLSILQLKQMLLIPASESFDIITPEFDEANYAFVEESSEEVFSTALTTMPEVKSAELQVESAEINEKIAKGANIPVLTLGAQIATNFSSANEFRPTGGDGIIFPDTIGFVNNNPGQPVITEREIPSFEEGYSILEQWEDNFWQSAGFNLRIPIFNGYQTRTEQQRSKIRKMQAEVQEQQVRQQLRQTIETAYNDAEAALKVYESAQKQVQALEEQFRTTERSYNLGAVNYVDYQVASYNLFSAKSDLLRGKYDYIFKMKVLDFYLSNELKL
jgi:outer membrane protein